MTDGGVSRRKLLQAAGAVALSTPVTRSAPVPKSLNEGPDTPKLCLQLTPSDLNEAGMRLVKQLGVDWSWEDYSSYWQTVATGLLLAAAVVVQTIGKRDTSEDAI